MEVKFKKLTQEEFENFVDEVPKETEVNNAVRYYRKMVQAAVKVGWLEEPHYDSPEAVLQADAEELAVVGMAVLKKFRGIITISPS